MYVPPNADPPSFEKLLESAFMAQESLMRPHSADWISNFQELLATGQVQLDGALHVIAAHAREVANAAGVAIAIVRGDELVYRAGNGSAAGLVGRRLMATLIVSAAGKGSREILRVENSETDPRIEAAVCRQFGSKALLILPLHYDGRLAGALEIFFHEPHSFSDHEFSAYEMMAGLVGQAITQTTDVRERKTQPARMNQSAICPSCGTALADKQKHSSSTPTLVTPASAHPRNNVRLHLRWWSIADAVAVAMLLATSSWIAYTYVAASHSGSLASQTLTTTVQQAPLQTSGLLANKDVSGPQPLSSSAPVARKAVSTPWQRVRVGENEIDDISEDVTIRHFIRKPPVRQVRVGNYQVDYVSEDVTVRHFIPHPAQSDR